MLYLMLVFGHLLATSMALGAIVATDLRMLSKLSQDRVRIPPPNEFVARLVTIALVLLYATGAGMLWISSQHNPDFLNPKLQGKLVLVLLLTFNAVVLHRITFPRLARGRSVRRWRPTDWIVVVLPVSLSNCLWMFCAFLGIARPWNHSMPMQDVLVVAGTLYVVALVGVGVVLVAASRPAAEGRGITARLKRALASVGALGRAERAQPASPAEDALRDRMERERRRARAKVRAALKELGVEPRRADPRPARKSADSVTGSLQQA